MRNLADLITRYKPGKSLNEISDTAGLPRNRLGYYLKPGSKVTRVPTNETVTALAGALGCQPQEVIAAFVADLYGEEQTSPPVTEERQLVSAFRSLRRSSQEAVLRLVQDLAEPVSEAIPDADDTDDGFKD